MFIDAAIAVKTAQDTILTILEDLEASGLKWHPHDHRNYSAWRVMPTETGAALIGPQIWNVSAHLKLEVESALLTISTILNNLHTTLEQLGGHFQTPLSFSFERRYNGMVFYIMNFAIKGCLDGDNPKKWVLPKVLARIHPIPTGTGVFKMGHHTFCADSPETVIKLYLILSAPKTDPKTRKKPKDMAQISQIWDFQTIKDKQSRILEDWKKG